MGVEIKNKGILINNNYSEAYINEEVYDEIISLSAQTLSTDFEPISYDLNPYSGDTTPYIRPTEWLELPALTEGDNKFIGLHPIFNDNNFCAIKATTYSGYTVDWGDGIIENYNSNDTAYHFYNLDSFSGQTGSTYDYKQTIVQLYPTLSGDSLLTLDFRVKPLTGISTYNQNPTINWLDIKIVGSNINNINLGNTQEYDSLSDYNYTTSDPIMLEQFEFIGTNKITSVYYLFGNCRNLQKIVQFDTSLVTNFIGMFNNCLFKEIDTLDTSNGTNFSYMFQYCYLLKTIPLIDTSKGTNFSYMFQYCHNLRYIPLINTSNGINFYYMFQYCYLLKTIPLLNTSNGINFSYMFRGCKSLLTIPLIDTSNGIYFSYMFRECKSLLEIPLINTMNCFDFSYMFQYCYQLQTIPLLDTSSGITMYRMFRDCSKLQNI
ncbi:BspA family leucine-rich repeat surface protein, partial [Candidatus Dojkabacteria bacterium]|nr:BspA family leucine-rich repeat surface protein [Candidatus Dojkabacteria bacterium]